MNLRRALLFLGLLGASVASAQDLDGDGILDERDNCILLANPEQQNSDFDRYGNACDGDVNQDGVADAGDRARILSEVSSASPRPLADLNGDGLVDAADLDHFDSVLAGQALGPAGALAHDEDGDGTLDFCGLGAWRTCMEACEDEHATCVDRCDPSALPRLHIRDPLLQPSLLANGDLNGTPPAGWSDPNPTYVSFTPDIRAGKGAIQWSAWGGAGRGAAYSCGSSCIQPDAIPVTPGRGYAYAFDTCTADSPPTVLTLTFIERDASGTYISETSPLNNSKIMNSAPGVWEQTVYNYRPSSNDVASVQPLLFRKTGPAWTRGTIFAADFAFWELSEDGSLSYDTPVQPKKAFDGARTRVDELGNTSLFRDGEWIDFFPFGIYTHWAQDYSVYSDVGFNVVMNERGFGVECEPGIDAVSALNPEGMLCMFLSGNWHDPQGLQLEDALSHLTTRTSPVRGITSWDHLLGFNYDNEIFSRCGVTDDVTGDCIERMWSAAEAGLARIFAEDRAQNGGVRGVPSYFLNGNPGVARAYISEQALVNDEGDTRMDVTGSYGAANVHNLQRIENQAAPAMVVQVQESVGDRYRSLAWAGLAAGARMIGTWRDWPPTGGNHGVVRRAPVLRLCGATDFGLSVRGKYFDPAGQILVGVTSGARAELLDGPDAFTGCAGDGASYDVHLLSGEFLAGESLVDEASGLPVTDAAVFEVAGDGFVDYELTITTRGWYQEIAPMRREIDALLPILRESHWTGWEAHVRATAPDGSVALFGNDGVMWGGRTHDEVAYLIVANTGHELDPYAAWDEQYSGSDLDLVITPTGLEGRLVRARRFDRNSLAFTDEGAVAAVDESLSLSLPALDVVILQLETEPWPPSEASDVLAGKSPFLVEAWDEATGLADITWSPACGASDHGLLAGPLAQVATHAWDSLVCGLGTSGSATVPISSGSRFLAIVGRTSLNEGSGGRSSTGEERPGSDTVLSCSLPQLLGEPCP